MKAIFVGPQGIRSGWRFAFFVLLLFSFSKLCFWFLTTVFHHQEHAGWFPTDFLFDGALSLAAALMAAWIMSKIERRQLAGYGLPWRAAFRKHFWQGALWGFTASFLMIILLRVIGAASFEGLAMHGQTLFKFALLWAAAFLLLGFAEEFTYRGYSQTTLTDGMGFWPAAVLLSAIFGSVHYFFKPMENWMDGLSVGLFGLFWCFSLRRTGSLWFAIGFHAMSDYADMVLFAQPNTGNNGRSLTGHVLNVSYQGPEWLTGGPRGTEASALEFLILALLFVAIARVYPRISVRSDMPG
jgi:membrane protease YdiL (CAAX protease family)